jgi:hypothetical protein
VADASGDHAYTVVSGAVVGAVGLAAVLAVVALVALALAILAGTTTETVTRATLKGAIHATGE